MNFSLVIVPFLLLVILPGLIWMLLVSQKTAVMQPFIEVKENSSSDDLHNAVEEQNHFSKDKRKMPLFSGYFEKTSVQVKPSLQSISHAIYLIKASYQKRFQGYDILQTLESIGFSYEADQYFHYYLTLASDAVLVLMDAKEPHTINLSEIGAFETETLMLVLHHPEEFKVFEQVAAILAEELGGELHLERKAREAAYTN